MTSYELDLDSMGNYDWMAVYALSEWVIYNLLTGSMLLKASVTKNVTDFFIYLYPGTHPISIGRRSDEVSRVFVSHSFDMLSSVAFAITTIVFILGGGRRDLYALCMVPFMFSFANFWSIDRVAFLNNKLARL